MSKKPYATEPKGTKAVTNVDKTDILSQLVDEGVRLRRSGQEATARKCFERARARHPGFSPALLQIADMDLRAGAVPRAIAGFQFVLRIDPSADAARAELARSLALAGRITEAIDQYQTLIDPADDWQEQVRGETQEGGHMLCPYRLISEDNHLWRHQVQNLLARPGIRVAALVDDLNAGVEIEHEPASLLCFTGDLLASAARLQEAETAYRLALQYQPGTGRLLARRAEVLARRGDHALASDIYRCAAQCSPPSSQALTVLGRDAYFAGRFDDAIETFSLLAGQRAGGCLASVYLGIVRRAATPPVNTPATAAELAGGARFGGSGYTEGFRMGLRYARAFACVLVPWIRNTGPRVVHGGIATEHEAPEYFHHLSSHPIFGIRPRTDLNGLRRHDEPRIFKRGAHLYGGVFFRHFGHFMAESVHRLWTYTHFAAHTERILVLAQPVMPGPASGGKRQLIGYERQALAFLGIPEERLEIVEEPTRIEELIVGEQAAMFGGPPFLTSPRYFDFLTDNEARFFKRYAPPGKHYPEKLYVGRSHLIDRGGIAGEAYIEDALRREGFMPFLPETHSLFEQLNHYRHARVCIFSEGSAIHGLELLGKLSPRSIFIVIARRAALRYRWEPLFRARTPHYACFSGTALLPGLFGGAQRNVARSLALVVEPAELLSFLRAKAGVRLERFDVDAFFAAEALDIAGYLARCPPREKAGEHFRQYNEEFMSRLLSLGRNRYLRIGCADAGNRP